MLLDFPFDATDSQCVIMLGLKRRIASVVTIRFHYMEFLKVFHFHRQFGSNMFGGIAQFCGRFSNFVSKLEHH